MTLNQKKQQKIYFDRQQSRYTQNLLLTPPLAQKLELEAIKNALGLPSGSTIMDFGCGNGRVSVYFLKLGYNVIGVDLSPSSRTELTRIYSKFKTPAWGILTTAVKPPSNRQVEGVVGADVLHHVDIYSELPKLFRVLKRGGRVAFSEPNAWHLPWYLYWYMQKIPWEIEKGVLQCTIPKLNRDFNQSGFKDIKITPHGLLPTSIFSQNTKLCRLNVFITSKHNILKFISFRFIITAQK